MGTRPRQDGNRRSLSTAVGVTAVLTRHPANRLPPTDVSHPQGDHRQLEIDELKLHSRFLENVADVLERKGFTATSKELVDLDGQPDVPLHVGVTGLEDRDFAPKRPLDPLGLLLEGHAWHIKKVVVPVFSLLGQCRLP